MFQGLIQVELESLGHIKGGNYVPPAPIRSVME